MSLVLDLSNTKNSIYTIVFVESDEVRMAEEKRIRKYIKLGISTNRYKSMYTWKSNFATTLRKPNCK